MTLQPNRRIVASIILILAAATLASTPADEPRHSFPARPFFPPHEFYPHDPPGLAIEPRRTSPALSPEALRRGGYQSVQVNVDEFENNIVGDAANEPSIAVDPTSPNRIVIGWRQFDTIQSDFREAGWGYSHDAGHNWTFGGVLQEGVFRSDPVLAADADGDFHYYSMAFQNLTCQMFKSMDGGVSWQLGPIPAFGGGKPWMAIDRTGGIGHGNIYCAWSPEVTRSTDGGLTYMYPVSALFVCGTIAVAPEGEVYIGGGEPWRCFCGRSLNAQDPQQIPEFEFITDVYLAGGITSGGPNPAGLLGQVWIACDYSDGPNHANVYMLASVDPQTLYPDQCDVMFARSTDRGETWSPPVRINDDPAGTEAWQWFGTMSVAPNGRIDVIWNDTRNSQYFYCWSELFYSYSTDGGLTWSANEPITPAFDSRLGWPGGNNKLGDYYHMISDNVGADLAYAATFNGEQDIYFLRIGDYDCNGNGVGDILDIVNGTSPDFNGNGIPDECEGLGDLNCDGVLDESDVGAFVMALADPVGYAAAWPDCDITNGDCNGNGRLDAFDIDPFVELLMRG